MDRETALKAIQENVKNENLIKHMLATEAIMRALARRFNENEDEWGLAGLLHDIDVELTHADLKVHSKPGAEMAKQLGASEAICRAALVRPDKKLAGVEAKSIRKRFKEERFAAGANREQIAKCSEIGLELDAFIELGLEAMKGVAGDLGLA
jgi:putative nucleotidyltransferase with HDIG domain